MIRIILALLLWSTGASLCLQAQAERQETLAPGPIDSLDIEMKSGQGNFMVIDARMRETATAAVFGGIIGASINSAVNADQDADAARPFEEAANGIDVAGLVEASLRKTLAAKDFPMADAGAASHILTLEVKDWGLSRVSFEKAEVAVFLKVSVVMKNGKTTTWDAYVKEAGRPSGYLSEMTPERFSEDMKTLAAKTGKRIAYEIIYR